MALPTVDFIGIGVQRAATTWLTQYFRSHPGIWVPPRKELHYFSRDPRYPSVSFLACRNLRRALFGKDPTEREWRRQFAAFLRRIFIQEFRLRGLSGRVSWAVRYFMVFPKDEAWYRSLFREGTGRKTGEITPAYSLLEETDIAAVARAFPDTRVILVLRNPVDRALSQLSFYRDQGWLPKEMTDEQMLEFLLGPEVMMRGDYEKILTRWSSHFGPDRFHVGWYDDFERNPERFVGDILCFLGLPPADSQVRLRNPSKRTNRSNDRPVPLAVRQALAGACRPGLVWLSQRHGGHATRWLAGCDALLDGAEGS